MIINNPKNRIQTVISGEDDMHDDYEEGLMAASEEMMKAIKSSDIASFKSALQAFVEMCDEMPHEEGEHLSESEEGEEESF